MNELDVILDDCLTRMASQSSNLEQCLALYPDQAASLRPLLIAATRFDAARAVQPRPGFTGMTRAKLLSHAEMRRGTSPRFLHPAWRLTGALVALVLFAFLSTTAFAQTALPGAPLYSWKLSSEHVWRAISPDPVGVDLSIVDRRATELTRVVGDPILAGQARDEFHEALIRLASEKDGADGPRIDQALLAHQKKLLDAGIQDNELDDLVHGKKK